MTVSYWCGGLGSSRLRSSPRRRVQMFTDFPPTRMRLYRWMSSAFTIRLGFTINVCFADRKRAVIKWIATASPIPVYSSGQPVAPCFCSAHSPTSGLLTTSSVGTSESRKRFHSPAIGALRAALRPAAEARADQQAALMVGRDQQGPTCQHRAGENQPGRPQRRRPPCSGSPARRQAR